MSSPVDVLLAFVVGSVFGLLSMAFCVVFGIAWMRVWRREVDDEKRAKLAVMSQEPALPERDSTGITRN